MPLPVGSSKRNPVVAIVQKENWGMDATRLRPEEKAPTITICQVLGSNLGEEEINRDGRVIRIG